MELRPITLHENKNAAVYASVDCQHLLSMYEEYYPKIGFHMPWVGYVVIKEGQVVGSCGFTGRPVNGSAEIAYWTFKEFEGQGVASFACGALVALARETDPGVTVTAKTAPEHNASTKILEKNCFLFTGIVQDHEIGDAWHWTHQATQP